MYFRKAFVLYPLYEAAEAAVDAHGYPTFSDNQHLYPGYVSRFGSFLDVTAGMSEQNPPTRDEYCV